MSDLTIHQLDDSITLKLQQQALKHGRSVEAEVKALLAEMFADKPETGLASKIQHIVHQNGDEEINLPSRELSSNQRVPDFSDEAYG